MGLPQPSNAMLRIEISDAEIQQTNYERFRSVSPIVQKRMHVIYLKSESYSHQAIAKIVDVHPNTVTHTLRLFQTGGLEAVRSLNYKGPQSELVQFGACVEDSFRPEPPLSVNEASDRIAHMTGVRRQPTQIRNFMKHLGMRYRKAGHIPGKAKPEKQAEFLENELEPLIESAKNGKCHLFFVDAAHFVYSPFICMLWCFSRIFIQAPSGRFRYNVLGAIHATTRRLEVITNEGYVNSETISQLLRMLKAKYTDAPIYLVMDNARYQRCKFVEGIAESLNIQLVFLPPYSPNLNLIERLWKFVKKKALYAKYYDEFKKFKDAIDTCIFRINNCEAYQNELANLLTLKFQRFEFSQNQAA